MRPPNHWVMLITIAAETAVLQYQISHIKPTELD